MEKCVFKCFENEIISGRFSILCNGLFDGRSRASIEFIREVGTIIIGGDGGLSGALDSVQIITPKSSWPVYQDWQYELQDMEHHLQNIATSVANGRVYVAGGDSKGSNKNYLQMVDFNNVRDIADAASRTWGELNHLAGKSHHGVLFAYDKTLFYSSDEEIVEVYDLPSQSDRNMARVNWEGYMSGGFIATGGPYGGNFTLFLGKESSRDCPIQTQRLDLLDSDDHSYFQCVDSFKDGSIFPGELAGRRVSYANYYPWYFNTQ